MKKLIFLFVLIPILGFGQITISNTVNSIKVVESGVTVFNEHKSQSAFEIVGGMVYFKTGGSSIYKARYSEIDTPVTASISDLNDTLNSWIGSESLIIIGSPSGNLVDVKENLNSGSNELLVNQEGHECLENSTSTLLLADAVFTGSDWQKTIDYGTISIAVGADVTSAVDGLVIQWSNDGINVHNTDEFTILANMNKTFTFGAANKYVRIKYTNGAVNQGSFYISTILRRVYIKPSSHRIDQSIVGEDDAELQKSVLTGEDESGIFENVRVIQGQTGYNLKVSLDQIEETTNSVKMINYSHAELHSGDHYAVRSYEALLKNGVKEILIITPNTTRWAHLVIAIESVTSAVAVELYEAATYSAIGTIDNERNRNRNFADDNTTLVYEDPTITGTGDLLHQYFLGAGKNSAGGGARDSEEILLRQNTVYLLRMTEQNLDATVINWVLDWYEHTNN